jgi:hypothetical protein
MQFLNVEEGAAYGNQGALEDQMITVTRLFKLLLF